ncbi:MAG: hypothetical protein ACFE8N_06560, partial [Promethearchaeota archaeon]
IKNGDISQFKDFIAAYKEMEFLDLPDSLEFDNITESKEKCYYILLARLLSSMRFKEFRQLINYSDKLGIFIEVKKIPFRLKIIANLHLDGIQRDLTGRIFQIIRFFNEYNLFEIDLTNEQLETVKKIKTEDKNLIANLGDLFGNVSNSLIYYSCKIMPYDLYLRYVERAKLIIENEDRSLGREMFNLNFLKTWTDWYSMYGLHVRNLGSIDRFLDTFEKNYAPIYNPSSTKSQKEYEKKKDYIEFNIIYRTLYYDLVENHELREVKNHFVFPKNILKNKENFMKKDNYNFYSLSMVLLGGLGPEGLGFTYSTPRGEIIEICSDQKETEAIIIKFKQYLKQKFLVKLEKEMQSLSIEEAIRKKITDFLSEILKPEELISYSSKDSIIRRIKKFISQIEGFQKDYKQESEEIINKITVAVSIILRSIKLKDQFMARMGLVAEGKLKSEDIAQLTEKIYYYDENNIVCFACNALLNKNVEFCPHCQCSRGKTHYDVLRERFFFQNEINWFFKDYAGEIRKLENRFSNF